MKPGFDPPDRFQKNRIKLNGLISSNKLEEAEVFARETHAIYHDRPIQHTRIHLASGNIALVRKYWFKTMAQYITGFVFAIPVSLAKQCLHRLTKK